MPTRSRMPAMPWPGRPAAAAVRGSPRAVVGDLQRQRVRPVGDRHPAAVGRRMLDHVGDRLLDHPVGGQVEPGGQRGRSPRTSRSTRTPASAVRSTSCPGPPARRGPGPASPAQPSVLSRDAGSGCRRAARRAAPASRAARRGWSPRSTTARGPLPPGVVDHVVGDPGLHRDQAHRVRDHVVQLAGDLQSFLADGPAGLGQLLAGPLLRLLAAGRPCTRAAGAPRSRPSTRP